MMTATSGIGTVLDSLIDTFLGKGIVNAVRRKTYDHIGTIVSNSVFSKESSFDAEKAGKRITKRNVTVGNQFCHVWRRLQSRRDLSKSTDLLKFLVLIGEVKSLRSIAFSATDSGTPSDLNVPLAHSTPSIVPPVPPRAFFADARSTVSPSLPTVSNQSKSNVGSFSSASKLKRPETFVRTPTSSAPIQNQMQSNLTGRNATEAVLAEDDVVRNVLVALQGIEGQYVRWSPSRNRFAIDDQAPISSVDRARVFRLLDCGTYYRQVEAFVNSPQRGMIVQAFAVAVQDQIKDYLGTLAMLHSQCGSKTPPSLLGVEILTRPWFNRLRCLCDLIDASRDLRGLQLLSCVHQQWKLAAGDDVVHGCMTAVFNAVCVVFHRLLVAWLAEGLIDNQAEFLIDKKANVSDACMWSDRFSIRHDMIPSIFERDVDVLSKILVVGKSVAFLRLVHSNRQNELPDLDVHKRRLLCLSPEVFYEHDKRKELDMVLSAMYNDVSHHLLTVMNEHFMLKSHLSALKNYMLLGSGDFARSLFDEISSELDSEIDALPSASVVGRAIVTAVESARPGEHPAIVACLDAEPWTDAAGDDYSPMDAFTLKYRIAGPITAILPEKILRSYQKLFKFIWSVHRLEFALTQLWKTHKIESPRFVKEIDHSSTLSKMFSLLFMEMITMLRKFHFYLLYDVIEYSWKELQAALDKQPESMVDSGFDYVIKTHEAYVRSIEYRLFLTEDFEDLGNTLSATLEHMRTLVAQHGSFVQKCSDELDTRSAFALGGQQRLARDSWVVDQDMDEDETARRDQFVQDLVHEYKTSLDLLKDQYRSSIGELLRALRAEREQVNLNHLFTQLDFARFYEHLFPELAETPHTNKKSYYFGGKFA